jgi:predicted RNA-binding protein with PUA-like domain
VFSIDDLARAGTTAWEGVRNYQARNHMRDDMKIGDPVLFYHSNATPPAIVGLARVASVPHADATQFDGDSAYHDPKATRDAPRWILVDVAFVEKFAAPVTLEQLRDDPALTGMLVAKKAHRPSVQPVERAHFLHVTGLGGATKAATLLGT